MDNTDSEMIESLNILRPPVRRDYKTSRFGYQPNTVHFMSEWRKPKKRTKGGKRIKRSLQSSTSLILKKTTNSQIFDRYPVVSYTNTSIQRQKTPVNADKLDIKEKPLIKVIVVPNDQPSEGKQSEKNKITKIYLNNPVNDNLIETKNVYLIVSGKKKDKIYEIKTTESATLSTAELKDETVSKVFNGDCFKQLIKSLNMERKKGFQIPIKDIEINHVCKCSGICTGENNNSEPYKEFEAGRSKVRIYGQLGLTEDDRYMLKCSATVNDKPVPTTFSTVGQKASVDLICTPVPPQRTQKVCRDTPGQTDTNVEQHKASVSTQARNNYPTNDYYPRRNQKRDSLPLNMPRQSQRRPTDSPPVELMSPRGPPQVPRRMDEYPPINDTEPRRTLQSQRWTDERPHENDLAPRKTQQSARWMDEYPPGNDMTPRRTPQAQPRMEECPLPPGQCMMPRKPREPQRRTIACPPGVPLACQDGRERQQSGTSSPPTRQCQPRPFCEERYNNMSRESQGTQVNMRIYSNIDHHEDNNANKNVMQNVRKSQPTTTDKDTQCTCNCVDPRLIKGTQSPLVIISVYPNPDVECKQAPVSKTVEANIESRPEISEQQRYTSPRQSKKPIPVVTALKESIIRDDVNKGGAYIHKSYRISSRSPTPQNTKRNNTENQKKVIETRMVQTRGRSQSPAKIPNKSSGRSSTSKTIKTQESKKTNSSKQKITPTTKNSRNTQMSKNKSKPRSIDKCSGNQTKPKSLIADIYKKTINERVKEYNRMSPKHNVSAVSINIDSENERYDVSFHQGQYTTDLYVHKSLKNWDHNDSTINFLPKSRKSSNFSELLKSSDNLQNSEDKSKLKPRDSLELSHRHNVRQENETQTHNTSVQNKSVSKNDSTSYLAPIKHFTGDNCNIVDPLARDKEIQQLLGVSRRPFSSQTTDMQTNVFGCRKYITQQCCGEERECKDTLYTSVEFEESVCSCCCLKKSCCPKHSQPPCPPPKVKYRKSSCHRCAPPQCASERHFVEITPICSKSDEKLRKKAEKKKKKKKKKKSKCEPCKPCQPCKPPPPPPPPPPPKVEPPKVVPPKVEPKIIERKEPVLETSLYQQLVLHRNVHIFLQIDQFCKQKPIILTKQQYDKVKKTIQKTLSKSKTLKNNKLPCECVQSLISIGQVRKKQKNNKKDDTGTKPKAKKSISKSISQISKKAWSKSKDRFSKKNREEEVDTLLLYSKDIASCEQAKFKTHKTMSSVEVRYASISYLKHVTYSSKNAFETYFEPLSSESSLALKDPISIETLFKGHKKSPTPNLGTSTLSCLSEPGCSASLKLFEKPNHSKRPFLKRLMSCLVMRSDKTQMPTLMPPKYTPTVESSFDSYHFSTSLGAIEMTSSLYDTSASFFSNHSVYPKTNKMKRGFLNSMRGLLQHRRS